MSRRLVEVVPPTGLAWCHACHAAVERLYYDNAKVSTFTDRVTGKQYEIAPALLCRDCIGIKPERAHG